MFLENTNILNGKQAIVTGAGGGIGAHIALTLAQAGAHVALLDIDPSGLEKTEKQIEQIGKECSLLEVDLGNPESIEESVDKLYKHHPVWDILVNNAAIVKRGALVDLTADEWDLVLNVNLKATFLLSRAIVPAMMEQRSGKIINISSNASFYGTPDSGAYAVSKAGMNQLTKTMAIEWGPYNIQSNLVCPGLVNTELAKRIWDDPKNLEMKEKFMSKIPIGRFANIEEISPTVLFLASSASDYINGAMITIDDGARYNPN